MHKEEILSSQTISSGTNSNSVNLKFIDNLAVQVVISATTSPSGANVKLQGSNDDTNFTDIDGTSTSITDTGDILLNIIDPGYKYIRARFEIDSGDITARALLTGRERRI